MIKREQIRVMFVEDDDTLREAMVQSLKLEDIVVEAFDRAAPALDRLKSDYPGVIVSDIRMPGMDGMEFFEKINNLDSELPFIFITGHGDVSMAVTAMKKGAADFLTKPYSSTQLINAITKAADKRRLVIENRKLKNELNRRDKPRILGSSDQAEQLRRMVAELAAADIDLMITGDSGTGKSFVAQQIHELSQRHDRPFITIDPGTVAHRDAELIVFGRAPGSALSRSGLIERANGGTLFLDGIEAMPASFQARLLSVVEDRSILPIGADRKFSVNIRVISATRCRDDIVAQDDSAIITPLFHRLNGISINLPSLRNRREDIPEIFRHFILEYERELDLKADRMSENEWLHLNNHDWNGNLRELRAFARNFTLGLSNINQVFPERPSYPSLKNMVENFERAVLEDALRQYQGKVIEVASALKIQRKTLYDKLSKYNLNAAKFRPSSLPDRG